jgi:hypothetical protein
MNRRTLFALMAGAIMTPEGLWTPGKKTIILPARKRYEGIHTITGDEMRRLYALGLQPQDVLGDEFHILDTTCDTFYTDPMGRYRSNLVIRVQKGADSEGYTDQLTIEHHKRFAHILWCNRRHARKKPGMIFEHRYPVGFIPH